MVTNFQISFYYYHLNYLFYLSLLLYILSVISFIVFQKLNHNKTYNKSISNKSYSGMGLPSPTPPNPPKKSWKEKVKEHLHEHRYIYICAGIAIIGGILYITFGNGDPRGGAPGGGAPGGDVPYVPGNLGDGVPDLRGNLGGNTPDIPHGNREIPNRFILGTSSGSTFSYSENIQNVLDSASHEALIKQALDEVSKTNEELTTIRGIENCVNLGLNLILTLNSDLSYLEGLEQTQLPENIERMNLVDNNETPTLEAIIPNLLEQDLNTDQLELNEELNQVNGDEYVNELDRFVDSVRESIRKEAVEEGNNLPSPSTDQRDLRNFLEARNLAYYQNLSRSNYDFYQNRLNNEIDAYINGYLGNDTNRYLSDYIQASERTNSGLYDYRLPELPEQIDEIEELNNLLIVSDERYLHSLENQSSLEWNSLDRDIEQFAAARVGSLNQDQFTMDDIRYLRDNQYPNLPINEVINILISDLIGHPTPLVSMIENNILTEDLGYYFLREETQTLIQNFDRSVFQYLFSQLTTLNNGDYVKSSEFYSMVTRYLRERNFERLQTGYNRNGDYYDEFIKQLIEDILSNEPSIGTFVNGNRDRLHVVLAEITSIILSEAAESMVYPYVYSYDEMNRLIRLCLALNKHLGLGLDDFDTLDLLVFCLGLT